MPFHLHKFVSGCKQLAKWKRLALISWLHWYGIVLTEEEAPLPQGAALRFLRARSHLLRSHEYSPPGSSVHGIPQARILEWVAISPGDLPDPGIEPRSPALQADNLTSESPGKLLGVGKGRGGLACCSPWGHKSLDTTELLNWTQLKYSLSTFGHFLPLGFLMLFSLL